MITFIEVLFLNINLQTDLGAGLGFTGGLTCFPADSFTPTFGRAPPLEGFLAEEAVVAPLSPLAASVFCFSLPCTPEDY